MSSYFTPGLSLYPAVKIAAKNVTITARMIIVPEPIALPPLTELSKLFSFTSIP